MLVNYSDSGSEDEDENAEIDCGHKKRKADDEPDLDLKKRPPPLPSSFHSLYNTAVRAATSDDPSLHAGRTRQIPHVVGNWPTHVYLEWYPLPSEVVVLDSIIQQTQFAIEADTGTPCAVIHSFLRSDLGVSLPLHISLSAPLVLKTEQKAPFQESLEKQFARLRIKSFSSNVIGLDWVSNHDKSRFFLVLRLSRPSNDQLNQLLSVCNTSARQFSLPLLYHDPGGLVVHPRPDQEAQGTPDRSSAFHISIAWTLEQLSEEIEDHRSQLRSNQFQELQPSFDRVKVKIGNVVLEIPLDKDEASPELSSKLTKI